MAISQDRWLKAKTLFEMGLSLSEIETKTGIEQSTVSKKAKSQSWMKGINQDLKNEKVKLITGLTKVEVEIQEKINPLEKEIFNNEIYDEAHIASYAKRVQYGTLSAIENATATAKVFIKNHPKGTYLKSEGDKGESYGLVTEVIPHLAQGAKVANDILHGDKPLVQINQQNNTTHVVDAITQQDAADAYLTMINGDK